jgi:polyhydroxyalkanoate synthesis regulator phasin
MKNKNQIHALKTKLTGMRDDLLSKQNWTWAELSEQQAKIRALKSKITKLENAR